MSSPANINPKTSRAIRLPELCYLIGVSKASVWRWSKRDPEFPKPYSLSEGVTVWDEAELEAWLATKKAGRHYS